MVLSIKDSETKNEIEFDDSLMSDNTMYVSLEIDDTGYSYNMCIDKFQAELIIEHLKLQFDL